MVWSFPVSSGVMTTSSILRGTNSPREEVEEVFAGNHKVRKAREKRYLALGETLDGRLAFVVFRRLPGGMVRVITARDMDASERRLFRRK
jgi:hypothetical protein